MAGIFRRLGRDDEEDDHEVVIKTDSHSISTCCGRDRPPCLVGTIVVLVIVCVGLFIGLVVTHVKVIDHYNTIHADDDLVCVTEECITATGEIVAQMNMSANPCTDFFNYACGGFIAREFLGPSDRRKTHFDLIGDDNTRKVFKELSDEKKTAIFGKNSTALTKAKKFHKLCMDQTALQRQGHKPLLDALADLGTPWSIQSDQFDPNTWNFTEKLLALHTRDYSPFLGFHIGSDDDNSTNTILEISQRGLTLSSEKDYNSSANPDKVQLKKDAFINYGIEVARLLGNDKTNATRQVFEDIYELEKQMADIFVHKEDLRDPTKSYKKLNVTDLQKVMGDHIQLVPFLSAVTKRTNISDGYVLATREIPYLSKLKEVFNVYLADGHKKSVLNDYLTWVFVRNSIGYLGTDFQFAKLILKSATDGVNSIDERWKICTGLMDSLMGRVTGALFIEGRFTAEDRDAVVDMVESVKVTLTENFEGYKWMDKETAEAAIDKANQIKTKIGYPDYIADADLLDKYYEELPVPADDDTYLSYTLKYFAWEMKIQYAKLDKPADPTEWKMVADQVNAYYDSGYNQVVLPAGILQKPFYGTNLPLAWNYGGMGSVIGHELSHGFDDQGSQYDKDGNLRNWWTEKSTTAFKQLKQCFIDQYSAYKVGDSHVNGRLCLGENIADNGGVAISYKAYLQKLEDTKQKDKKLPGLDLSDDQLFFLSFAQIWCAKETPEYAQSSLNTNPHSPSQFRVQGTYSNSQAFSEAFQCKSGTPYNPPQKCKVW